MCATTSAGSPRCPIASDHTMFVPRNPAGELKIARGALQVCTFIRQIPFKVRTPLTPLVRHVPQGSHARRAALAPTLVSSRLTMPHLSAGTITHPFGRSEVKGGPSLSSIAGSSSAGECRIRALFQAVHTRHPLAPLDTPSHPLRRPVDGRAGLRAWLRAGRQPADARPDRQRAAHRGQRGWLGRLGGRCGVWRLLTAGRRFGREPALPHGDESSAARNVQESRRAAAPRHCPHTAPALTRLLCSRSRSGAGASQQWMTPRCCRSKASTNEQTQEQSCLGCCGTPLADTETRIPISDVFKGTRETERCWGGVIEKWAGKFSLFFFWGPLPFFSGVDLFY